MVIQKFNKVIRNKWVWGFIATLFCVMFVGSDILANFLGGGATSLTGAGQLGGQDISMEEFRPYLEDEQINNRNAVEMPTREELNLRAWQELAAVRVVEASGIAISNDQLAQSVEAMFAPQGDFDFERYRMLLQMNLGLTPELFEAYLRRQMMVRDGLERTLLSTAAWASPMEIDRIVSNMTDVFTVRVASFKEDPTEAAAITVDEAALKAWYEANQDAISLPELTRIRFVKFDATNPELLAKMVVTEDDLRDYYDANSDQYPSSDTNNVAGVKAFEDVRGDIEKKLRQIEAVTFFETNLNVRVYGQLTADATTSRLDTLAAEENLPVQTSGWFTLDGRYVEGFMTYASMVLPGAKNFLEVVAELDPTIEDLRYGLVSSANAVWLIEKAGTQPAHLPTFEEAKGKIDAAALRDAKAEAFKAKVEAIARQGKDAVLATSDVSTNLTFTVSDLARNAFKDQNAVVRASGGLKKGEVSEFTLTGTGRAVLVVCEDRVPGDEAKAMLMRTQAREQATLPLYRTVVSKWPAWNLKRQALQTTDITSIEAPTEDIDE